VRPVRALKEIAVSLPMLKVLLSFATSSKSQTICSCPFPFKPFSHFTGTERRQWYVWNFPETKTNSHSATCCGGSSLPFFITTKASVTAINGKLSQLTFRRMGQHYEQNNTCSPCTGQMKYNNVSAKYSKGMQRNHGRSE
jgi:hypothetical protein